MPVLLCLLTACGGGSSASQCPTKCQVAMSKAAGQPMCIQEEARPAC